MRYFVHKKAGENKYSPWKEVSLDDFISEIENLSFPVYFKRNGELATAGFGTNQFEGRVVSDEDLSVIENAYSKDLEFLFYYKGDFISLWSNFLLNKCNSKESLENFLKAAFSEIKEFNLDTKEIEVLKKLVSENKFFDEEIEKLISNRYLTFQESKKLVKDLGIKSSKDYPTLNEAKEFANDLKTKT